MSTALRTRLPAPSAASTERPARAEPCHVDTGRAADLERTRVDDVRLRRAVRTVAAVDDECSDAPPREQERRGEPDGPGAHDENGDFNGLHRSPCSRSQCAA